MCSQNLEIAEIRQVQRGAFEVSLVASLNLIVNESHLCVFKRHEVTGHRFCFVQASLVRDKLIFKVG